MNNIHKNGIARHFSRAAPNYDRYAGVQRDSGELLRSLLGPQHGQIILDAGCGTGLFSRYWQANGDNQVIALDISAAMLDKARQQNSASIYLIGDIEKLPIATGTIDIAFSNLAIQWCDNIARAITEFYRVLRSGGILAVSTLAKGSLVELEQAWKFIDDNVHINCFLPEQVIKTAFSAYRHYLITEIYTLYYKKLTDLLYDLKGVGASYLYHGRMPGLTSPSRLRALEKAWPQSSTGLPLSYKLVYGVLYRD